MLSRGNRRRTGLFGNLFASRDTSQISVRKKRAVRDKFHPRVFRDQVQMHLPPDAPPALRATTKACPEAEAAMPPQRLDEHHDNDDPVGHHGENAIR